MMNSYAIRTQSIRSFSSEHKLDENDTGRTGNRNSGIPERSTGNLVVQRSVSFGDCIAGPTTKPGCESEKSLDGLIDQIQEDCGNSSEFDEIPEVIEDALEATRRLRNAQWEDLERIRTAFQKFQSMLQDHGVLFLQNFLDLGGVYRLLLYLKHNEDNSECISFVGRILSRCLHASQTREPKNDSDGIHWIATGRNSFQRSVDCQKIAHETVTMIVKRKGIESFLRANDRCIENLKASAYEAGQRKDAKDVHQQTAENVWTLYGIWGFTFRTVHDSSTVSTISRGTVLCLFDSALSTLEMIGNVIDRIDEQGLLDRSYLAYGTLSYVFKTLRQIVKHSSIDNEESFSKTHKDILKKCAAILESNYRSGHLRGRYRRKIWIDAVYFFLAFFKKFQLRTSKKRFQWFWHDDILTFFVRVLREFPGGEDNLAIFKILQWISSGGLVTKFSLLQEHGVATAISTVLESKQAGAKSKKLARLLLKSLCE